MKAVPFANKHRLATRRSCPDGSIEASGVKMPDISLLCPEAQKIAQLKKWVWRDDCNSL
jgi:hypothetical protein